LLDKQARDFEPTFTPGQTLGFRLRANPTRRHNGKREGIYLESDRLAWLERKAAESGFDLVSARVRREGRNVTRSFEGKTVLLQQVQCRMRPRAGEGAVAELPEDVRQEAGNNSTDGTSAGKLQPTASFSAARFDGLLQVNDAKRFLETLTAGIGSGKAFGFGLLSVAKA
jgi:CRISPR system Cascade subunit CasE